MNAPAGERVLLRRAAAAAVLGALALLVALGGPDLWIWAAYEPPTRAPGFELRVKRWSWLPGPSFRVPRQPCVECQLDNHVRCSQYTWVVNCIPSKEGESALSFLHYCHTKGHDVGTLLTPSTFHCTCCGFE